MLKQCFASFGVASLFLVASLGSAQATTIVGAPSAITIQITQTSSPFSFIPNVSASGLIGVFDPAFEGFVYVTSGSNPSPNSLVFGINYPGFTEADALSFDFTTFSFQGTNLSVAVTGSALGTVTDPALTALLGTNILNFSLTNVVAAGDTLQYTFSLAAPEPATFALEGGALGLLILARKRFMPAKAKAA